MKDSRSLILILGTIILASMAGILLYTQVISRQEYATPLEVARSQPFYRSPKDLAAEGVVILDLARDQEEQLHNLVRTFFVTKYRDILRDEYNEYGEQIISEEVFAQALIAPPSFSEPRWYEDLDDIEGAVAIIAGTEVYLPINEGYKTGATYVFFFREDKGQYLLDEHFSVGEDGPTFETWPVGKYRDSLTASE